MTHADATPVSKEIVTTNACPENIVCAILGWSARSQGGPLGFTQNLLLPRFVRHVTPMAAPNLIEGGYAAAICEKR